MKTQKKIALSILLTVIISLFQFNVYAAPQIGDAMGEVLYSDIMAYIDGKAIPTSIKSGTTMVVVEDLAKYGFDVVWNKTDRTLKVERNAKKKIEPIPVEKDTTHKPGTFKCNYVYTDIKTYLSGQLVESFAIDGRTLIDFELLAKYGMTGWDGTLREIKVDLDKEGKVYYLIADYYNNNGTFSSLGLALEEVNSEKVLQLKNGDIFVISSRRYMVTSESLTLSFYTQPSRAEAVRWWSEYIKTLEESGAVVLVK